MWRGAPLDRGLGCATRDQAVEAMLAEAALTLDLLGPDLGVRVGPPEDPAAAWRHLQAQEADEIEAELEHRLDLEMDAELEVLPAINALSDDVAVLHRELESLGATLAGRDLEMGTLAVRFWKADGWRKLGFTSAAQYARCSSPTCGRRDVTPHHLLFRGRGGGDEDSNLKALCVKCHLDLLHGGMIVAEPPADEVRWLLGREGQMEVVGRVLKRAS